MKLFRVNLIDGEALGVLKGFEHHFAPATDDGIEPYCFVGENGTGKSRLLQCLAEIFCWVDTRTREFKANAEASIGFRFELEYEVFADGKPIKVLLSNTKDIKRHEFIKVGEDCEEEPVTSVDAIRKLLPRFVVGYTSGENETLSIPFLDVKQDYATEVRERALKASIDDDDIPELLLVMMDYHANFSIIAANFLLQPDGHLQFFKDHIRVSDIDSFRIIFQLNHQVARRVGGVKLTDQLKRYINQLERCSTCHSYDEKDQKWIFDFLGNPATKDAFRYFFKSAYQLCMAFQRLAMLNDLMIPKKHRERIRKLRRTQKLVVKPPTVPEEDKVFRFESLQFASNSADEAFDYISLSDGEHQFTHIFGTLLMFNQPDVLFLFDEPESHFNPKWRINFVPLVTQLAAGKHQCLLLTSHAPFVISDCKADNVYIFRRGADNRSITSSSPKAETYGAAFDRLLEDVFNVKPPVSRKSLGEIRTLQKDGDAEEIRERIDDFGESSEKFYLYQRLEELQSAH